jgi:hypothetical protein
MNLQQETIHAAVAIIGAYFSYQVHKETKKTLNISYNIITL